MNKRGVAASFCAMLIAIAPAFTTPLRRGQLASASGGAPDIRGTWDKDTCYAGGATYPQQWHIGYEDLSSGHFKGWAGNPSFQIEGTISSSSFDLIVTAGSYTSHEVGAVTVKGDTISIQGTFKDNNGTTGTCDGTVTHVRLSGNVVSIDCSSPGAGGSGDSCRKTPRPGVTIGISGAQTEHTTTGSDGSYEVLLAKGAYTVTPHQGDTEFDPNKRTVNLRSDLNGVDFTTCAASGGSSSAAGQGMTTSGSPQTSLRTEAAAPSASCPPDHIDWQMTGYSTGDVPKDAANDGLGMVPTKEIYAQLLVNLTLTKNGKPYTSCGSGTVWTWKVTPVSPAGAKVDEKDTQTQGCPSIHAYVSTSGTYRVEANEYAAGKAQPLRKKAVVDEVKPQQVVIAAMGDSNGSGEGLPPFYYTQCNRGVASYQYQAAQLLEKQSDGHTAVTFVSASCSGARTQHLVDTAYAGIRPGTPLPPQIAQLEKQFTPPSGQTRSAPDATLISIGVNNIAFGPLIKYCYVQEFLRDCEDSHVTTTPDGKGGVQLISRSDHSPKTLRGVLDQLLKDLPKRYAELDVAIKAHPELFKPGTIYISQYPAFWFGAGSQICRGDPFFERTWSWLANAGANLNARVAHAAHMYGWHVVVVPESAFWGHGYCSPGSSYFVWASSARYQGNEPGAFHPTTAGARVSAVQALHLLCPLLGDKKAQQKCAGAK